MNPIIRLACFAEWLYNATFPGMLTTRLALPSVRPSNRIAFQADEKTINSAWKELWPYLRRKDEWESANHTLLIRAGATFFPDTLCRVPANILYDAWEASRTGGKPHEIEDEEFLHLLTGDPQYKFHPGRHDLRMLWGAAEVNEKGLKILTLGLDRKANSFDFPEFPETPVQAEARKLILEIFSATHVNLIDLWLSDFGRVQSLITSSIAPMGHLLSEKDSTSATENDFPREIPDPPLA